MADMKTLTLGGKTFNIMDAEARAKAIPTVQVGGDTLTWDGNTEGLESVDLTEVGMGVFYNISHSVVTYQEMMSATINANGEVAENGNGMMDLGNGGSSWLGTVIFVPNDGYEVNGIIFPTAGVWASVDVAPFSLTIPGYTGFGEKKIDPAYLYQPDWNQNDETAPGFIKNRPFGGCTKTVALEEQVLIYDANEGVCIGELSAFIAAGDQLVIKFDGTIYNCEALEVDGMINFGNLGLAGGEDTGEPFVGMCMGPMVGIMTADQINHTVGIYIVQPVKIDKKYIDAQSVFYNLGDEYLYTNVFGTTKATKADVVKAAKTGGIVIHEYTALGLGVVRVPVDINLVSGDSAIVIVPEWNGYEVTFVKLYTAEYVPPTT